MNLVQCIGVAYTFDSSKRARARLPSASARSVSSPNPFSYFYKGNLRSLSGHGGDLRLRNDPSTGEAAVHSPEPELAMFLGERHRVTGYCLANDLTAVSLEGRSGHGSIDATYLAKVWIGSGSFGPCIVPAAEIGYLDTLMIGLRIVRSGVTVFDSAYSISERNRELATIPDAIVDRYNSYDGDRPRAKRVVVTPDGYLPAGTLIMLGTGLDITGEHHCRRGDVLTVYSETLGELSNVVR